MKTVELRQMSTTELHEELKNLKREHLNLRIQQGVGQQVSKPHLFKQVRGKIARVNTILAQKKVSDE